ncbi:MAG: efflux RND transporter permease subunit [Bacteroidota bacterium]
MKWKASAFSILIFFALFTCIGVALLPSLSIQWLPSKRDAALSVQFTWQNASPSAIEQDVITPLEGAFNLVQGVESIYSIANRGYGSLQLKLSEQANLDYLRFEIAAKIRQLYPKLPEGVSFPTIRVYNPEKEQQDRPILSYSLSASTTATAIYEYASERLSPKLALLDGVENIRIVGGNEMEWRIRYEAAQGFISPSAIAQAIQQAFVSENLGVTQMEEQLWRVRLNNSADAEVKATLENIVLRKSGGQLIFLKDVADIQYTAQKARQYYRINGENSVRLLFYAAPRANQLYLAKRIKAAMTSQADALPSNYQIRLEDDATTYLVQELKKIAQRTLLSLVIILLFVLIIYRNWRYLVVVLLSLFANLGIAFIFYWLFQVELHLYALAGITVSFGILVDNSIVMMHHLKEQGNLKVFPALLAATLTTISALSIIWFLPEQWQLNLLDFAKVLAINLVVSLFIALLLIPALLNQIKIDIKTNRPSMARLRRRLKYHRAYKNLLAFLIQKKAWVITGIILLFGLPVFLLPNKLENQAWYNKTLGNTYYVEAIKPTVNRLLGGTLRLFLWYVYEGANYRTAEETVLHVQASMPQGASLEQMNQALLQIESYLQQFEVEIKQFTTRASSGQYGNIKIYFEAGQDIFFPHQLKSRLIAYSLNMGGIKWNIYGVGKGFSNDSGASPPSFRVMMKGYNKTTLEIQATNFADKLLKHPRIQTVNTAANINWWEKDLYEYQLNLLPSAIASANLLPSQLGAVLQSFDRNPNPNGRLPDGTTFRLIPKQQLDLWHLRNEVQQLDSSKIAFAQFANLAKRKVPSNIHKEDQQYLQLLEFEYTGSARFGSKYLEEVMAEMEKEMPLGYSAERTTWQYGREQKRQYALLLLVIGLIFFVCTLLFESFKQALTTVLLIPTSFIGIFLTFYLLDFPFDQGGYTAFILLSGIVVNSLILIINDYNQYRKQSSRSSLDCYLKAFHHKIIPILLSIISTILGLIPFLIHGQQEVFWFALAIGTIGGLLFSVMVILFFIPVFFISMKQDYTTGQNTS